MLRCWIFHVDNGVGTCEVPAELTTSNWRDVDGDFYSGMTVTITTDLGKGGWQLDKQSTSGWKGSKLVLGCGRKGLNGEGSTVYLVNLQEITAKGEAYDHYVYKTDDGFLKVKRHGGTVGSMDWTLEPVPATGGDDLEDATFIPIAGTGYCRVEDGAGAQHHTPWGTVDGTSDDDCKKQCGDDADCIAVTWDPEQKQCELMCDKPTGICSNACGWTVGHPNFDGALPDSASNIQFVDTGACFQSAGKLTGASFTAGRAEQDGKKFQVYREHVLDMLRDGDPTDQISVAYRLLQSNRRLAAHGHTLRPEEQQVSDGSFLTRVPPQRRRVPDSPAASRKAPAGSPGGHPPGGRKNLLGALGHTPSRSRWHLGMRSQNPPDKVMTEVYRAMRSLNFQWKVVTPYHARCRCWNQVSGTMMKMNLQLYRANSGQYLLDLQALPTRRGEGLTLLEVSAVAALKPMRCCAVLCYASLCFARAFAFSALSCGGAFCSRWTAATATTQLTTRTRLSFSSSLRC